MTVDEYRKLVEIIGPQGLDLEIARAFLMLFGASPNATDQYHAELNRRLGVERVYEAAMGVCLIEDNNERYSQLADILGGEDYLGEIMSVVHGRDRISPPPYFHRSTGEACFSDEEEGGYVVYDDFDEALEAIAPPSP
jgi:hypothetical protein